MNCVVKNKTRNQYWKQYKPLFEKIALAVEKELDLKETSTVSVILVTAKAIHKLNRDYRGIDRPTDVITFAASEGEIFDVEEEKELGDIFINVEAVISQAVDYDHSEEREIGFLFTHGVLHCLGYDHMEEKEEKIMFDLQKKILDPIVAR